MSAPAFELPPGLEAQEPAEARGLGRDGVRLLVTNRTHRTVVHARFGDLPQILAPGDLLVLNTSATLAAALPARREDGLELELHLSTPAPGAASDALWIVELRRGDAPFAGVEVDDRFDLPAGASAQILEPYAGVRLWLARLDLPQTLDSYLAAHGQPIRYGYVPRRWPMSAYQTVYALEPRRWRAGRPFTAELITKPCGRRPRGLITLHTPFRPRNATNRPTPSAIACRARHGLVNAVQYGAGA
jgi:S-adenosylmethionine:tRNA ribosyltransferase-isomerase